jgi:hypothetical protein
MESISNPRCREADGCLFAVIIHRIIQFAALFNFIPRSVKIYRRCGKRSTTTYGHRCTLPEIQSFLWKCVKFDSFQAECRWNLPVEGSDFSATRDVHQDMIVKRIVGRDFSLAKRSLQEIKIVSKISPRIL